jgi:UDP-glucose 4-epimerase
MTILVTGGAGYIGSHMVHQLVDRNEPLVVLDNLSTGFERALPKGVAFFNGDVSDFPLVSKILAEHSVSTIVHFAGSAVVPDSMIDPLSYYENNTSASRLLIEAAVKQHVKYFIFSSTAAVYGSSAGVNVGEDVFPTPVSPYGWSKFMTEVMLKDASRAYGLKYVILRYFNVAGADPLMRTGQSTSSATHLIKVAVQAALGYRPQLEVYGTNFPTHDGTCVRDYIHVSDLVRAHLDAIEYLRAGGESEIFNCGYGRGFSVLDVLRTIQHVTRVEFPVVFTGPRAGDLAEVVAQSDKIRKILSWKPRYDNLETIITHALAWEKKLSEQEASVNGSKSTGPLRSRNERCFADQEARDSDLEDVPRQHP